MDSTVVTVEFERTSRRCWNKFGGESLFALYSPFFVGLAAGNLSPRAFGNCIYQDYHFLRVLFTAYELAEENCEDGEYETVIVQEFKNSALQKVDTYEKLVQEWGFEFPKEPSFFYPTHDYRRLLIKTASGKVEGKQIACNKKVAAYTFVAIVPYMRLYCHLFQEIQNNLDPSHTPNIYKKWIDYYSSRDFEALVSRNEYVLDKLSRCLDGDEIEVVDQLYHRALRLQIKFFADLPMDRPTLVPILRLEDRSRQLDIFFDYEKTCIVIDSAVVLAEAKMRICEIFGMPSATFSNKLRVLYYLSSFEFEQCFSRIESSIQGQQVFDFDGLWRALKQVAECERRANARLAESRLLHNLGLDDINCAASIVILRKGCREFFQKIAEDKSPNVNVHVVSYCCSDLMRFVFPPEIMNIFSVHTNELAYEDGLTTGDISRRVETSFDKLRYFCEVILRRRETETKHMTVCIGGDVGDLLCLLGADIGIVVSSPRSNLMRVGHHFGVKFVPLFPAVVKKQKDLSEGSSDIWKSEAAVLYTVSCWLEIEAFILGSYANFFWFIFLLSRSCFEYTNIVANFS